MDSIKTTAAICQAQIDTINAYAIAAQLIAEAKARPETSYTFSVASLSTAPKRDAWGYRD